MRLVFSVSFVFIVFPINAAGEPKVPPGYVIEVYADGFRNPNAIAFSPGGSFGFSGELFVGDARPDPGTIYRVPQPRQVIHFSNAFDSTPRAFEFGPIGSPFEGRLYATHAYDIATYDSNGQVDHFISVGAFPWDIEFGPGDTFGGNLFYADGQNSAVYRITSGGIRTSFVTSLPHEVNGLAFSTIGPFGNYLYVVFARGEGYPNSPYTPAIRRVSPAGAVSDFVLSPSFDNPNQIIFDTTGNFENILLVSDSTRNTIWTVDSFSNVTSFATGFRFDQIQGEGHINDGGDLALGPDGALYVADGGAGIVYRISYEDADCDANAVPDRVEINPGNDCNHNRALDSCDLTAGRSYDCNNNKRLDECELVTSVALVEAGFTEGLPTGWGATGLWHISQSCAKTEPCDPISRAYFGNDGTCTLIENEPSAGVLTAPLVTIPSEATYASLEFCSLYEGERGRAPYGFDSAWVSLNGAILLDIGTDAQLNEWQSFAVPLPVSGGQSADVEWNFDTVDGQGNQGLGWQVDGIILVVELPAGRDCDGNRILDACDPDCNHDGRPDACEPDTDGDSIPDVCDRKCDLDHDGVIDLFDYSGFFLCIQFHAGPGVIPLLQDCSNVFDMEGDGDVDLADASAFQRAFGVQSAP